MVWREELQKKKKNSEEGFGNISKNREGLTRKGRGKNREGCDLLRNYGFVKYPLKNSFGKTTITKFFSLKGPVISSRAKFFFLLTSFKIMFSQNHNFFGNFLETAL